MIWLKKGKELAESGHSEEAEDLSWRASATSDRSRVVADLAVYDEAIEVYSKLAEAGEPSARGELAKLCFDAAMAHGHLGDLDGADSLYQESVRLSSELMEETGSRAWAAMAVKGLLNSAAPDMVGDNPSLHIASVDRAVSICEQELAASAQYAHLVGKALSTKATLLGQTDVTLAAKLFLRAMRLLKSAGPEEETQLELGMLYMNSALLYRRSRRMRRGRKPRTTLILYGRAIGIFRKHAGDDEVGPRALLGIACLNRVGALKELGQSDLVMAREAVQLLEKVSEEEGWGIDHELALAYSNLAIELGTTGEAKLLFEKAVRIWAHSVLVEGQIHLLEELALGYYRFGNLLDTDGNPEAGTLYARSISCYERMLEREAGENRRRKLNDIRVRMANMLRKTGRIAVDLQRNAEAQRCYGQAVSVRRKILYELFEEEKVREEAIVEAREALAAELMALSGTMTALESAQVVIEAIQQRQKNIKGVELCRQTMPRWRLLAQSLVVRAVLAGEGATAREVAGRAIEIYDMLLDSGFGDVIGEEARRVKLRWPS